MRDYSIVLFTPEIITSSTLPFVLSYKRAKQFCSMLEIKKKKKKTRNVECQRKNGRGRAEEKNRDDRRKSFAFLSAGDAYAVFTAHRTTLIAMHRV